MSRACTSYLPETTKGRRLADQASRHPRTTARNPTPDRLQVLAPPPVCGYAPAGLLRGRERAGVGLRLSIAAGAVVLVAALGAAGWFVFFRDGAPLPILNRGPDTPEFSFRLAKVTSVALNGKPSKSALRQSAAKLRSTLDDMYAAGFVDPDKWEEGTFPEVLDAFAGQASRVAGADLDDLTLGNASTEIDFVEPGPSRLEVRFLLGQNKRPYAAVATTRFKAKGDLARGGSLLITHEGRFIMRPLEGRWAVVSYWVDGTMRPRLPAPGSPGSKPAGEETP
jgi:hypothetical protein